MEEKNSIVIKTLGIILIIYSIYYLIVKPMTLYEKMQFISESIGFWEVLSVGTIADIFWRFFILLITGIGILKLKLWARYLILILAVNVFVGTLWKAWFFGSQRISLLYHVVWGLILLFILLFFNRGSIKERFGVGLKKLSLAQKIFLSIFLIEISIYLLSAPLFIGLIIRDKDLFSVANVKPEKVIYKVKDSEYLINNCERQSLFGYSIYLPKDLKIMSASKGERTTDWGVFLGKVENKEYKITINLVSGTFGDYLFPEIGRIFNFKNSYELERTLCYSSWHRNPFYLTLKTMIARDNLEKIEEAQAPNWRGFVKISRLNKNRLMFACSLYDLKGKSSGGVELVFNEEEITIDQAKDIIASLDFETEKKDDLEFFNQGKRTLSNKSYTEAAIGFINALYINSRNPEYAYYLARSLFEDNSEVGGKGRWTSSKHLLEYALNLNSNYQPAKDLLSLVNERIEMIEKTRHLRLERKKRLSLTQPAGKV